MSRPRILDLFCGAGGAAMGYSRAGFEVVGVDIHPQRSYPFEFVLANAREVLACLLDPDAPEHYEDWLPATKLIHPFDAIHASPPCQAFTRARNLQGNEHPDLIGPTRELLEATGLPYVIENVMGAPLRNPIILEGQLFSGLRTSRPRLFETNWPLKQPHLPPRPRHTKMGRPPEPGKFMHVVGHFSGADEGRRAMGIDWMSKRELVEAIPPAYTEWIGRQLLVRAPIDEQLAFIQ